MRLRAFLLSVLLCLTVSAFAAEKAVVTVNPGKVIGKLRPQLFGTNLSVGDKARIADAETMALVRKLHLGSIRFPNGCQADSYDWRNPAGKVTVEEFLGFCDSINAEPYYTINMQGGTEGLEGPIPADAPLDETIKYKHYAPNPCGDTNYHFGTLEETKALVEEFTVKRALSGKRPILCYEMGNENWGQAFSDFLPPIYARTIEVYAVAMRRVVEDAKKAAPKLKDLKLHITAVGFPMNGNNQENPNTPDYNTNVAWTAALNDLHKKGIIDAVQEHFYPYGNADGTTLAWANHNLPNILDARLGLPNSRLDGYKDPKLAYSMPMEFTEWNVKCWGTPFAIEKLIANPGFEDGLEGWTVSDNGKARALSSSARRGKQGLLVESPEGGACEVYQRIGRGDFTHAPIGIWVKTSRPSAVKVFIRDPAGKPLGKRISPPNADMWQRIVVGSVLNNADSIELVLRVEGKAAAQFDEAIMYSLKTTTGVRPPSCETFEQQLFCVDALRVMAEKGAQRTHLHHLFGTYPCGIMNADGTPRDNYHAFRLFGGFIGNELVETTCKSATYRFHSGSSLATHFNGFPPTIEKVPAFSAQVSRTKTHLFLLMINRLPDREVEADIDLGLTSKPPGSLRILSGTDIDLPGCTLEEKQISVSRRFKHKVAPYSAEILAVRIK